MVMSPAYIHPSIPPLSTSSLMAVGMILEVFRDAVLAVVVLVAVSVAVREGAAGLARRCVSVLRMLYGVDAIISWLLRREVKNFLKQVDPQSFSKGKKARVQIPEKGRQSHGCRQQLENEWAKTHVTWCMHAIAMSWPQLYWCMHDGQCLQRKKKQTIYFVYCTLRK